MRAMQPVVDLSAFSNSKKQFKNYVNLATAKNWHLL